MESWLSRQVLQGRLAYELVEAGREAGAGEPHGRREALDGPGGGGPFMNEPERLADLGIRERAKPVLPARTPRDERTERLH
jgi:hypothetical protein